MEQQELETKHFMRTGSGGTAQSQQVMSLMSQVFIGSIFYEVTESQLRDAFSPYGFGFQILCYLMTGHFEFFRNISVCY